MTWNEIGKNSLQAAKQAKHDFPRSSISRAYYAAHAVLTAALIDRGWIAGADRNTPPHNAQPRHIGQYMAPDGPQVVRELRRLIRRLLDRRLDADYTRTVAVDASMVLDSIRDCSAVFVMLGVR
jgi:uncharacterized protein (UPF0332 family)